ncbi:DUF1501 domain-containing protein [Falsiroseomonas selenitidurans]|uniref:DUF1501 domain-containing protein n=1 Tax=Falsiroseomonas selenitidurans TaxID=2716335 RepID=A0ABX1EAN9_9PROT|nr:DUF1501 domain-containing protein [Falsiroseomonas selenitidurans]NKC34294.1 DUF1501 domain-containing protein [Falsiroseomonas selenitidurans]
MSRPHLPRPHLPPIGRRGLLLGLTALATAGGARLALAEAAPPAAEARLVVILLRGAMDGLHAVIPYGDPDYATLRGVLAMPEPGVAGGALDLGGMFGLHPKLAALHGLYQAGELLPVQAVAGPYRTRSHFDGQDLLEGGAAQRLDSGWLNRALAHLPEPGRGAAARAGLALGLDLPLLLRGAVPVGMWAPPRATRPEPDLYLRMAELLHADPVLGPGVAEGLRGRGYAAQALAMGGPPPTQGGFLRLATTAGRLLARQDGPRVAALELGGWDTHAGQAQRMEPVLAQLDAGIAALRAQLGPLWARTAVLAVTEFGRTARANGNLGTDHGTGGAALLAGGAVRGGRVLADWPGLSRAALFENRDLQPTRDLRALAKGLLRDHLHLPDAALAAAFPGSEAIAPEAGLLRG